MTVNRDSGERKRLEVGRMIRVFIKKLGYLRRKAQI